MSQEEVQFVVGSIAEYYSKLLLSDESKKNPRYYAYICQVYKGIDFKPSRVSGGDIDEDEN